MKFTVVWKPKPLRALADLWTAGPDRGAVAAASDKIDEMLAINPKSGPGIVKTGKVNAYIARLYPLGVDFDVNELDRMVVVTAVWRMTDLPQN